MKNMKTCSTCKEDFPKTDFYKTSSMCKPCKREYSKEWSEKRKKRNKHTYKWR